ncbi:UNVERIFIED_CONTAM: hypothetical protein HDU68_003532 [Siphonaria sp. JEL0065]|nr:hypothetical protein HDU68_003532 [Siphonaria sp. JEL0065]
MVENNESEYINRSLVETEVPLFLSHLETVFHVVNPATQTIGAPRGFFEHHWAEDFESSREASGVFASFFQGQIVSSVRVYSRKVNLGTYTAIGGFGDVATRTNHRGKGLAKVALNGCLVSSDIYFNKVLMQMADEHSHRTKGFALSVLHASAMGFPVYEKSGWRNIVMVTRGLKTTAKSLQVTHQVRSIDFLDPAHLAILKSCHALLAPHIAGSFVRLDDDWRGMLVIVVTIGDSRDPTHIVNIQIRDLFLGKVNTFADSSRLVESVVAQTVLFLGSIINTLLLPWIQDESTRNSQKVQFNFPSALLPDQVLDEINAEWAAKEFRKETQDVGTMYKIYEPFNARVLVTGESILVKDVEDLKKVVQPVPAGCTYPFAACKGVLLDEGSPVFGFLKSDAY